MKVSGEQLVSQGFSQEAMPVASIRWHIDIDSDLLRHMAIVPEYQWVKDGDNPKLGFWLVTGWALVPIGNVASKEQLLEREEGLQS